MIIKPYIFNLFFYSVMLLIGLDFVVTGLLVLTNISQSKIPKFIGYSILRIFDHGGKNIRRKNKLY